MPKVTATDRPLVIAIGGNSLTKPGEVGTLEEQRKNARETCKLLAQLAAKGFRLVITHGNGPQVGNVLLRVEIAAEHDVYPLPLDVCDSDTQGGIGYMIQQILGDEYVAQGLERRVATIVTQVIVDPDDPEFQAPSKPIGRFMTKDEAMTAHRERGWWVAETDIRGYRRVVPSPKPRQVVELETIKAVYDSGATVICAGGGGVPVYPDQGRLCGVEAVIDKDLATSLLARELGADTLIISTGVPQAMLNFGTDQAQPLEKMTPAEARQYLAAGQFPLGSMGPKIAAAIEFVEKTGGKALITDPPHLEAAIDGVGGTWVVPE
ncbi:MAG: carbamate kinase [Myxococcales bacterium]|nr:carbamate kinase [Myxococcales bacterium]